MDFSNVVRHRLVDHKINPSELARMTGHSPQYIHNLLNGNRRWNEESMQKVCDTLGLEMIVIPREEGELIK